MPRAADVFISYKAEDRGRIQPLVQALEADGYTVWWDQHIETGDAWRQTIERQLDAARCVVVAWSRRSVGPEGGFVRDEASRAQQRGVYVPITIDNVRVPLGFGESQATSLRGWRGDRTDERYQAVLSAVRRIAGAGSPKGSAPGSSSLFSRRAALAGAAVAVAAAGFGGWAFLKPGSASGSDSIAVLPFDNMSGDPAQGYFADGMAGEIRNTLTRIGGLKVAGSISSEAVRKDDARTAAGKLGVTNILTGNVRQTASTIRVTAVLIDGSTGLAKWSESYDRAPGDVIRIQSDIAQNVARALAVALSAGVKEALSAGETSNAAAQQLVYQARAISYQWTLPAYKRSLQLLDQAIALDPNYARAHAIKSFVAANLAGVAGTPAELDKGRAEALRYAQTALSIAPNLPIARSALAYAYENNLQLEEALREHSIALSLARGDPDVIRNYGWTRSTILGTRADALRFVDQALALDPLNSASHLAHVDVLFTSRRYAEAVSYSEKLKRESPELFTFPEELARSFLMLGRPTEAGLAFAQVEDADDRVVGEALLAARTGKRDVALGKLAAVRQRRGDMASYQFGQIYAQAGDKDRAFAALNRALEIRIPWLADLNTDPFIDPLRSDSRYATLSAAIGFPS